MNKSGIPWFVFNNKHKDETKVDVVRERRAIVITVCYGAMIGCLSALAASYCWTAFLVILIINAIIGFFAFLRMVFRFSRGDKV